MAPVSNTSSNLARRAVDPTTRSIAIGLTIGLVLLALTVVITWVMHCQRKKLRKKVEANLKEIRARRACEAQDKSSEITPPQYSENAHKDDIPLPSFEASMPQEQPQQQSPQQLKQQQPQ
jgi:ABC-type transport system involved in cytochrome bd biosynthesis fused ATPase/permease subunit